LCGETRITRLFNNGTAAFVYPLRAVFCVYQSENEIPVKVLVGAAKKRFKTAVARNRLKRLMREAYRLNKTEIVQNTAERKISIEIAFSYIGNEILDFDVIEKSMKSILQKIAEN
jgi:ribonuclease P protein component